MSSSVSEEKADEPIFVFSESLNIAQKMMEIGLVLDFHSREIFVD